MNTYQIESKNGGVFKIVRAETSAKAVGAVAKETGMNRKSFFIRKI